MKPSTPPIDDDCKLSYWLLVGLLIILWFAGGASRADVLGQAVVRFSCWSVIIISVLALPRVNWRQISQPGLVLVAAAGLLIFQLVLLPPSIWTSLPGRSTFTEVAVLAGIDQPWRPISIVPSGTYNALGSLIVPASVLLLAANLTQSQHWRIAILILALAFAGAIVGTIQFAGADFNNPLINTGAHQVSGNFANRNHFALFLAMGCVLMITIAFRSETNKRMIAATIALVTIFGIVALASGSRSGILIFVVAMVLSILAVYQKALRFARKYSIRVRILSALLIASVFSTLVFITIYLNRAESIERAAELSGSDDLRWEIWPIVFDMAKYYFPMGAGFGTFDPVFRIHEPESILTAQYINLAHNEWLQIWLEGGVFAILLMGAALIWFIIRTARMWMSRGSRRSDLLLGRAGSIIIALTLAASVTDYPARTPLMMAMLAIAATWLTNGTRPRATEGKMLS